MRRAPCIALALSFAALAADRSASAFCRSTTCQDSIEDCPRDDAGCKTSGVPLFWKTRCVGFSIQKDGTKNLPYADVAPVIERSFLAWTEVDCGGALASLSFSRLADVTCHENEYNEDDGNANIVLFQDDIWRYKGLGNTLAKTTVTFDQETGEIFDADIELNYAFNELTISDDAVAFDLQSILTHEVGHFIGMDHSDDLDATMAANYDQGDTSLRSLEPDDVAAACAAYPPDRQAICSPSPRNGLADACVQTGGGCSCDLAAPGGAEAGGVLLLGAALVGVVRSRRRPC